MLSFLTSCSFAFQIINHYNLHRRSDAKQRIATKAAQTDFSSSPVRFHARLEVRVQDPNNAQNKPAVPPQQYRARAGTLWTIQEGMLHPTEKVVLAATANLYGKQGFKSKSSFRKCRKKCQEVNVKASVLRSNSGHVKSEMFLLQRQAKEEVKRCTSACKSNKLEQFWSNASSKSPIR